MPFESLTLTPFCMEMLGVKTWIFQCFSGVFSAVLAAIRYNYARIRPLSLFYTTFLQILPVFLQYEINCWGGRDRKISALVSAPVSALYMAFGWQGWTAVFDLAYTVGPKD